MSKKRPDYYALLLELAFGDGLTDLRRRFDVDALCHDIPSLTHCKSSYFLLFTTEQSSHDFLRKLPRELIQFCTQNIKLIVFFYQWLAVLM